MLLLALTLVVGVAAPDGPAVASVRSPRMLASVRIAAGQPTLLAIAARSSGSPPRVEIVDPRGRVHRHSNHTALFTHDRHRHTTEITIVHPMAGRWRLLRLAGQRGHIEGAFLNRST